MAAENAHIFIGNIIHCKPSRQVELIENGYIIIVGAKILAIGLEASLTEAKLKLNLANNTQVTTLTKSQILIPGFVDTHIHAPQYPNCGLGYDKSLMDWLYEYTYPLEAQYTDLDFARKVFKAVVKKTISCGTTTACYFGTLYNESCNILVDTVLEEGQRAFVGKVNMTKGAPGAYTEKPEQLIVNTLDFVKYVQSKKSDLVKPIITPRFAISLDLPMMLELGSIAKCQDLHIQTHISENRDEIDLVQTEYGMQYADVYDEAKLLTSKTILAHGIFLTEDELKLISRRGSSIAHCPDSNLCLKSGACNVRQLWDYGIRVGLGSDISGGPNPSVLKVMKLCIYSSIHFSYQIKNYAALTYEEVFYLGTYGGSEALSLQKEIGNFELNKDFDALIIDMDIEDNSVDYFQDLTPHEILQKFIFAGDDRNIVSVYVAGRLVKQKLSENKE